MHNIWTVQKVKPFEAFVEFYNPPSNRKPRIREFFDIVWKSYDINQAKKKSVFHQVERIKIIEWHLNKTMNLGELSAIQKDVVRNKMRGVSQKHTRALNDVFFPLHDYNKLKGADYLQAFKTLLKGKRIYSAEDMVNIKGKQRIEGFEDKAQNVATKTINNYLLDIISHREINKAQGKEKQAVDLKNAENLGEDGKPVDREVNQPVIYDSNLDPRVLEDKRLTLDEHGPELKEITRLIREADRDEIVKDKNELDDSDIGQATNYADEVQLIECDKAFKRETKFPQITQALVKEPSHGATPLERYKHMKHSIYKLNKPVWPLDKIFVIYFFKPWKIEYKALMHYFGERLSLYFKFTAFYATMLIMIMFFGLAVYVIDFVSYYQSMVETESWRNANFILFLILALVVMFWSNLFYWMWLRKERQFLVEVGYKESLEEKPRVNFKNAVIVRSLADDFVNSKEANYTRVYLRLFAVVVLTILCYGVSFAATIGLFYLKDYTVEHLPDENWAYINQNIANGIEILKIIVFDEVFYRLAIRMITWVDPEYMHDFDNYLISVVMLFSLLNNYFILVVIIFLKSSDAFFIGCAEEAQQLDNKTYKSYCVVEAEIFFKLYVIFKIIHNLARLVWGALRKKYLDYIIGKQETTMNNMNTKRKSHLQDPRFSMLAQNAFKRLDSDNLILDHFDYFEMNKIIEKQVYLDISNESDDFDTTLKHYLELILSLTGVCWFGILFPLSFLLFYITIIIELYIDKKRYFDSLRRPSPHGKAALGLWDYIISLVTVVAIFTNAYIIAFLYKDDTIFGMEESDDKNLLFILMVIIGFILGMVVAAASYKTPTRVVFMAERQQFIIDKIMANKTTGMGVETERAVIKSKVRPWGEVDYEYYDKQREQKKKKILEEIY